jgi:hypothetical protein
MTAIREPAFAKPQTRPIQSEAMSAKIYYLRPFQRENLETPAAQPQTEDEHPHAAPPPVRKRPARNALPGGRSSKWKRKLGGGAVRREPIVDEKDKPSQE